MPSHSIQSPSETLDPNSTATQPSRPLNLSSSAGGGATGDSAAGSGSAYHRTAVTAAGAVSHPSDSSGCEDDGDDEVSGAAHVDCNAFVANAAVHGDAYSWHVDADPSVIPDSPWTQMYGRYFNRVRQIGADILDQCFTFLILKSPENPS